MERKLRITTGLILFAYAACHFLGHATGMFGVAAMESIGRGVILAPWRTLPGRSALFISLVVHGALGLYALFRRRHLRIPALEAWQLALGLAIPLLLAPHVIGVRVGASVFGLDDSYRTILGRVWIGASELAQHFALLGLVWAHGCIGLGFWLRRYDWSRRHRDLLLAGAVALPLLAALMVPLYRHPKRYYVDHMLLLVHNHACVFLVMSGFIMAVRWIPTGTSANLVTFALILYLLIYLYSSMRRVYGESRARTLIKFSVLSVGYFICAACTVLLTGLYSAEML